MVVLPILWWQAAWQTPSPGQLVVLAAFGFFQMGLPYILVAKGLRLITSWEVSAIAIMEPVLMPLWVFLFQNETPAGTTVLGAGLIFAGLMVQIFGRRSGGK